MTRIGRVRVMLLTVGCLNGLLLAQSPETARNSQRGRVPDRSLSGSSAPRAEADVGPNGLVSTAAVFDDGSGPALYIGGEFTSVNGTPANRIARWDGRTWSAVGPGITGRVHAMTVFDDGDGPALYVGGHADDPGYRLAKWDGKTLTPMAGEIEGFAVFALTVFDDGSGPALYVAGNFTKVGGLPTGHIARWDGKRWSVFDPGMNWLIHALTVFDDGNGPALYAGGNFTTAGGVQAENIARWDGQRWTALGTGVNGRVEATTVFDDGGGPALRVGGFFAVAGDLVSRGIAKWDGAGWLRPSKDVNGTVYAMTVPDDGQGQALYIGGDFLNLLPIGPPASHVAKWDGRMWSALGSGVNGSVRALASFDDGSSPALYVGGEFTMAGDVRTNNLARWDGTSWSAVGTNQ